jgi:NAD(P)-dependent dehydrogenase (short-subunit alcohol dehydrogenase family)
MQLDMSGRNALVTGGGSGIGKSVCDKLARNGAAVAIVDLDLAAAGETAQQIENAGGVATPHECDVSDHDRVANVVSAIEQESPIDMLVNNAGIAHIGNLEDTSEGDLDRLYAVNIKGMYNMMSAVIKGMKARRSGVIINVASIASSVGISDRFAYSMSKGAVLSMTYSVAKDYIGYGIRCNCVSPARIHTPFVDDFLEANYPGQTKEMFEKLSKSQPIGRMGSAEEVADLIAYLCSDAAAFITGSNLPIDGGFVTLNG